MKCFKSPAAPLSPPSPASPPPRSGSRPPVGRSITTPDPGSLDQLNRRVVRVGQWCIVLVSLTLLALLGRVYQLQRYPSPHVAELIDSQVGFRGLDARRGSLVDRRQRVIATTHVAHLLFVDPDIVEDPGTFSETVGYTAGLRARGDRAATFQTPRQPIHRHRPPHERPTLRAVRKATRHSARFAGWRPTPSWSAITPRTNSPARSSALSATTATA